MSATFPIVRPLTPNAQFDLDAIVTVLVASNPRTGAKNKTFFEAIARAAEKSNLAYGRKPTVREAIAEGAGLPILAELRNGIERAIYDVAPLPK